MLLNIFISFLVGYLFQKRFIFFRPKIYEGKISLTYILIIYYIFFFVWFTILIKLNILNYILSGTLSVLRQYLITFRFFAGISYASFFQSQLFFIIYLLFIQKRINPFFYFSVVLYFISAFLLGYRFILIPLIVILLVFFIFSSKRKITITKIFLIPLIITFIFSLSSFLRSGELSLSVFNYIFGYTTASINKLSFIIENKLSFPYAGNLYYLFRNIYYLPVLGNILGTNEFFSSIFSIQDQYYYLTVLIPKTLSEQNLNPIFNWLSFPGGVYNEVGNFYPIIFLIYGFFSGLLYKNFISKTISGLIFYPVIIFSILFWFGDNYLNYPDFIIGIFTSLGISLLSFFVKLFKNRFDFRLFLRSIRINSN